MHLTKDAQRLEDHTDVLDLEILHAHCIHEVKQKIVAYEVLE